MYKTKALRRLCLFLVSLFDGKNAFMTISSLRLQSALKAMGVHFVLIVNLLVAKTCFY
jgi:hypothetical protein